MAVSRSTLQWLKDRYGSLSGAALLKPLIAYEFPGKIALVSSFGAEAAVLLAMAAEIDAELPVLFIDTGKLFGETLRYRDDLVARLGLRNVRTLGPQPNAVTDADPRGDLWQRNADACCAVRKVAPIETALAGFDAWISGRKRYHGGERTDLPLLERVDGRIKVNPLADWSRADIDAFFVERGLPRHPLEADGFLSIGCQPCTARVQPGAEPRSGRWAGLTKTECGIHHVLSRR